MLKKKSGWLSIVALMSILMVVSPMNVFAAESENTTRVNQDVTVEIRDTNDLATLSDELDRFVQLNPDSTEEEQDAHLIEFIKNGGLSDNRIDSRGVGDYLPGYGSLNPAERKLALEHPVQAVKVYNAGKTATNKTIEVYGQNGWQDNSDAFRHCLWNALMKQSIGVSAAEKWATAHEYNSSGVDKAMDLHNNSIGRGINVSGQSTANIVDSVKAKVRDGSCRRIINGSLVATDGSGMK